MKFSRTAFAAAAILVTPSVSLAQSPTVVEKPAAAVPILAVGATVYDPSGGQVGTIESLSSDQIVIDTGTHKATLPRSALGSSTKGPTINATKAQIDALVAASEEKANAALNAALVPGAEVRGRSGSLVGTIKEVTGEQVLLDRPTGAVVLPNKAFATGPQGLVISMTAAELEAAAKAATPGS